MSDFLKLEKSGTVAVLTMNNPPANTWTPEALEFLAMTIHDLDRDPENYSLILASDNEKFFSAGADLSRFNHDDKGEAFAFCQAFGRAFEALADYQGVSIAAMTGFAMGGGLEAALCCDVRICERHAQMALPEAGVGLLPCGLGTQQLPWLVGEAWAKRMILLGERIDAARAEQIGLVSEVVDTGKVLDHALQLSAMAEHQSPASVRACKSLIMAARHSTITPGFAREREAFVSLWEGPDQREGVTAFLDKRKAHWTNR